MSEVIIRAENLGKRYVIGHEAENGRYVALRDVLMHHARKMWQTTKDLMRGDAIVQGDSLEEIWALRDINFEIQQGDVVGIIGPNGAGKSTLLKILSRITEPSQGRVAIRGSVASLLEIGTGFHPELTGRENIFLNGAILGMTRREIKERFDEIVAFSEVEKFLDTPVKRYSSGMFVRLAFAVAAYLQSDILIVDEVLAVGDAEFQKKCLRRMQNMAKDLQRTVLFVSHNMAAVQALCDSAMYLQNGRVKSRGKVDEIVKQYLGDTRGIEKQSLTGSLKIGVGLTLSHLDFQPNPVESGVPLRFVIEFRAECPLRISELAVLLYSAQGVRIAVIDMRPHGLPANVQAGNLWRAAGEIKSLPFVEGDYRAGIFVCSTNFVGDIFDLAMISVTPRSNKEHAPYHALHRGLVELDCEGGVSTCTPA